eukprot:3459663-Amphidinium_carterae.1
MCHPQHVHERMMCNLRALHSDLYVSCLHDLEFKSNHKTGNVASTELVLGGSVGANSCATCKRMGRYAREMLAF